MMAKAGLQWKMDVEVEHTSCDIQTTVTTSPSTASKSAPKASIFAKKSGFVIPKNRLSGSLVPRFRGAKKGDTDSINEEATKQVQRKTKWGADLTLDMTVLRGRALAYQTRIDQISQQLTLGVLELMDNEDLATSEVHSGKTPDHQLSREESELLELERREIIGKILKLNTTYKPPTDYKPLLKDAKVPIPLKEHPGCNFIGLVFGPSCDTHKRLEKETGAKIQVYGTKADTGGKVEINPNDGKEIDNAYEDMYVHVSADTFEKVDAAVALIELLVTRVSVNPLPSSTTSTTVSDENANTHPNQTTPSSMLACALINQGTAQPYSGSLPLTQGQFPQYAQAWFPVGPTQTPTYRQHGLVTPANTSASLFSNTVQLSSSPFNPSNMPSLFGPRPVIAASFSPIFQNPSAPTSGPQPPYMHQVPPLIQTGEHRNTPPLLQPATTQLSLTGPPHNAWPVISVSPQFAPVAATSDKLLSSTSESSRWLSVSASATPGLTNVMPMTPSVLPHGHNTMASQNIVSGGPLVNIPNNMISPLSGPSQASGPVANQQSRGGFSPLLPSVASESTPSTTHPSAIGPRQPAMPQVAIRAPVNAAPRPTPAPFLMQSSASFPQPGILNSFPATTTNFDSVRPVSVAIPRLQQPSSSDFTFQPHRPPNAASQVWQNNQAAQRSLRHPVQTGQASLAPQSPLLRPMSGNLNSPVQGFSRPHVSHQVNQPMARIPINLAGSPTVPVVPPRHPVVPGHNTVGTPSVPHIQPRNFIPPHPINSLGPFPPRPGSQMHIQENHLAGAARPQRFLTPHPHFGNHPGRPFSSSSGAQQVYDPLSPTSVSSNPQMGGNAARMHSESDPEYEDLMASVGVK